MIYLIAFFVAAVLIIAAPALIVGRLTESLIRRATSKKKPPR